MIKLHSGSKYVYDEQALENLEWRNESLFKKTMEEAPFNEQRFSKYDLFREKSETVFVLRLKPNQTMPVHKHPGQNLYLLGFEGEGIFIINDEKHACKQGDVFSIKQDEEFGVLNESAENFTAFAVMSKH